MRTKRPELVTDSGPEIISGVVYDAGTLDKVEITDAGFLRAPARITRAGVFIYRNADGSMRRELRLPEEVFSEDSLRTLALVPLTREHPQPLGTPVTLDNRKTLDVGVVGNDARREGDYVAATVQVEDGAAIDDVKTGRRRELSAGYNRDLELAPGKWNGIPYDGIQRRIRYNHVALTESGRAGPDARIRLDSNAAVMVCDASEANEPTKKDLSMKFRIVVDGVTYEVESESASQAIQKALGDRDQKLAALDSQVADVAKKLDMERARADNAETELKKAKALVEDSNKPEKIREAVKTRLELERAAKPLLVDAKGQEPDLAPLTDEDIKRKVILVHDSTAKLDGVSAEYLEGRYQGAVASLAAAKTGKAAAGQHALQAGTAPNQAGGGRSVVADANESRKKLHEESEAAWQKPLGPRGAAETGAQS